jgi:SAM-dependent methyltransferase
MAVIDSVSSPDGVAGVGGGRVADSYKREFWIRENLKHAQPHYRLQKTARLVNRIAAGRSCDLLDVGCGPATLGQLLDDRIRYYGIDIAIHDPAANLLEADILQSPIRFGEMRFDIVVAQGLFEYVGDVQGAKFGEIAQLLEPGGTFVVTYTNFGHRRPSSFEAFSNVQPFDAFVEALRQHFIVSRFFPTAYNWSGGQPRRSLVKAANMHVDRNIPVVGPRLAVEYFVLCSPRGR